MNNTRWIISRAFLYPTSQTLIRFSIDFVVFGIHVAYFIYLVSALVAQGEGIVVLWSGWVRLQKAYLISALDAPGEGIVDCLVLTIIYVVVHTHLVHDRVRWRDCPLSCIQRSSWSQLCVLSVSKIARSKSEWVVSKSPVFQLEQYCAACVFWSWATLQKKNYIDTPCRAETSGKKLGKVVNA